MSQMLSEGIVNELLVTNSEEANRELTKLHEQLFNRMSSPFTSLVPCCYQAYRGAYLNLVARLQENHS